MDIPDNLTPGWERRYPGRLQYELDALKGVGIKAEIDRTALESGKLVLEFDWPLDKETQLHLRAIYPDGFPHLRPEVFLVSGLEPRPERHLNPFEGNLCLLGRESRQWTPGWTLCRLLTEQLYDAINGTGDEDPQGEPSEFWWNCVGYADSVCLIDSSWTLGDAAAGELSLRYIPDNTLNVNNLLRVDKPVAIKGYISEIYDKDGHELQSWNAPLPAALKAASHTLRIPWVYTDQTFMPTRSYPDQVAELLKTFPSLGRYRDRPYGGGLRVAGCAVTHPSELEFSKSALSWTVFLLFGRPQAFRARTNPGNKNQLPIKIRPLRMFRAGTSDIVCRVPAVNHLREKRVLIVGIGAVGAPTAVEMARNGCSILDLVDHDIVEPGNTVRWPLGASAWGSNKLDALKEFIEEEYPGTTVYTHPHKLGQASPNLEITGDDQLLNEIIPTVDLVIDGSASYGVTTLLAERCRDAKVPLEVLFATPTVEGGIVARYGHDGGCPICLEYAWDKGEVKPPPGFDSEGNLIQPKGCSERTFVGADFDLQELSLQAVRVAVDTLSESDIEGSVVYTLSYVDSHGRRLPPTWRVDPITHQAECGCGT